MAKAPPPAQTSLSQLLLPFLPTKEQAETIQRYLDIEQGRRTLPALPTCFPRDRTPYKSAVRFDLLSQLVSHLEQWEPPAATAVLTGSPGIGKTTLAAEYMSARRAFYDQLGWITAQPADAAAAQLIDLAYDLNLECVPAGLDTDLQLAALAEAVAGSLRRGQPHRVLLVIDDLDHLPPATVEAVWQPALVRAARLRLLLTSRQDAGWQETKQIAVGLPTPQAAAEFLWQRTGSRQVNPVDPAEALAAELGYHPEALEQAGAYIDRAGISIMSFLNLARELKAEGQLDEVLWEAAGRRGCGRAQP